MGSAAVCADEQRLAAKIMKGPPPETYEEGYQALAPVVLNLQGIVSDLGTERPLNAKSKHLWQALSYQAKVLAARIDHMLYTEHVAECVTKHGKHSDTSCPPNSRAMCSYRPRVR